MKNAYFRFIEVNKTAIISFLKSHPHLVTFIDANKPFYVRISKKPYPGLIHTILCQDERNEAIVGKWTQLISAVKRIKPAKLCNLSLTTISDIFGPAKANLVQKISLDIKNKSLDLKELMKLNETQIIEQLSQYPNLKIDTIKTFAIFSLYKNNVLCDEDPDFIEGLKIYLNKQNIDKQDINNIKIEYSGQLSLFCLCMWKINNDRKAKN